MSKKAALLAAAAILAGAACRAQDPPAAPQAQAIGILSLDKYPGLLAELGQLFVKLKNNIQFPAPRTESRLLPLLPKSTLFYVAVSNYGEVADQSLKIFHQELQESAVLRDWWEHEGAGANGAKIEDALRKFAQLQQYLGDEIVLSGSPEGKDISPVTIVEVRKPGLQKYLREMLQELGGKSNIRVIDQQQLAVSSKETGKEFVVLVRPDFVIAAPDLKTVRSFNERLDSHSQEFATTPFGQRVSQEYRDGVTLTAAADAQDLLTIMNQSNGGKQSTALQQSGFGDLKYVVWGRKKVSERSVGEVELSFNGPRHGAAAWLATPRTLGSLDFVSAQPIMAATFVLNSPTQIFEDLKESASQSNSNDFATLAVMEQGLNFSLKDDVLAQLGGEVTFELDKVTAAGPPVWKAMLEVKDSKHLQQTLNALVSSMHLEAENFQNGTVAYHTLKFPPGKTTTEIGYAFVDGYLIVGSSRGAVEEVVAAHRSGETLAKSQKFLAAAPPDRSQEASAMFYENPMALAMQSLRQASPDLAQSLAPVVTQNAVPAVVYFYGEDAAIREVSTSPAFDAGGVLIAAAIAIPNLLRSRIAANEASAVGSVRTINTAEVTYSISYPKKNYAPNLATMGPGPEGAKGETPEHANLLDGTLANASCAAGAWCGKSGYRFRVTAVCKLQSCSEYLVVATPESDSTGTRSFCSTSDGVIRYNSNTALPPQSAAECTRWSPLQ